VKGAEKSRCELGREVGGAGLLTSAASSIALKPPELDCERGVRRERFRAAFTSKRDAALMAEGLRNYETQAVGRREVR
jgi:hypothetical protein